MRDLGSATRFVAGAIGPPGERTFYLEVVTEAGTSWFVVEKLQVAALAVQIAQMRQRDPETGEAEPTAIAADPTPMFRVAELRLGRAEGGRYAIELHPSERSGGEPVVFSVSGEVLDAMAGPALAAVGAGRPRCPRCGLAMDPDGHICPASNGDLRHHRP